MSALAEQDVITGDELTAKLQGVSMLTALSGDHNAGVIQSKAQQNGFQVAAPVQGEPQVGEPKTAMSFLAPK